MAQAVPTRLTPDELSFYVRLFDQPPSAAKAADPADALAADADGKVLLLTSHRAAEFEFRVLA